jgi:hypothetical protein
MPIPLVIQYRDKAGKLTICPSQRIYVTAFRPCLNQVPFQVVQLLANHKTTLRFSARLSRNSVPNFRPTFVYYACLLGSQISFCLVPILFCVTIHSAAELVQFVSPSLHC